MTEQANPLEKQYAKLVHRLLFECVAFWADFSPEYAKVFERVSDITKQKRPTAYTVYNVPQDNLSASVLTSPPVRGKSFMPISSPNPAKDVFIELKKKIALDILANNFSPEHLHKIVT